jgi:adenine deaminase
MSPGLMDGHIHIESTIIFPTEFCSVVLNLAWNFISICDPHEIANVIV